MPRTREQNQDIKDQRRQQIVDAALPLFALYNDKVSVDQICQQAKCSHGLFYHYFRDTDHLLNQIKRDEKFSLIQKDLTTVNTDDNISEILYHIINRFNGYLAKAKDNDCALLVLIINNQDKISFRSTLLNIVKLGQEQHVFAPGKPEDIVDIYLDQNIGVLLKKLLQKSYKIKIIPTDNLVQIFYKKALL